jgi:PAS domain S-box-containing protein
MEKLRNGEVLHITDVSKMPPEAENEKELLQSQNIKSLLVLPVLLGGQLSGFMGLDNVRSTGRWQQEVLGLLKIFSETLSNAFERKKAETTLQHSLKRNQALLQAIPDIIFVVNKDGTFLDFKADSHEQLSLPSEDIIGSNIADIGLTDKTLQTIRKSIQRAVHSGALQTIEYELEVGNRIGSFESRISRLSDNELLVNVREITERKRLEEEYIRSEKLESLGVLAGGIAHDFNNLLTAILGNISLSKVQCAPGQPIYDRLADAEKASELARDLTKQLLVFSKGGEPIKKTISILPRVKDAANFALRGSNVGYRLNAPNDLYPVEVDEAQISQLLHNIILNADQAMPNGGVILINCKNIDSRQTCDPVRSDGKYVEMSIQDFGVGIPKKHLKNIFDPYFTTKQKGSGLGLATAYTIAKKHDGYLAVESVVGSGTTFKIYLPASEARIQRVAREKRILRVGQGRIMVMDDAELVRNVVGSMLKKLGYDPVYATSGEEAVKIYQESIRGQDPVKLVIMDLTIPGGLGGKETIALLTKINPKIKAIVSSGYSTDPVMAEFKEHGFSGVVRKPYRLHELSEIIDHVLKEND